MRCKLLVRTRAVLTLPTCAASVAFLLAQPAGLVGQVTPAATTGAVAASQPRDLRNVLAPGYLLEDRNQDGLIDFVRARIILPAAPSSAEVASAANIAARLGYETSALDLGLTAFDDERVRAYDVPVIVVGERNALIPRSGRGQPAPDQGLAPGQGAISFITPNDFFRAGGILIEGYDATGLLAAASYLSGRYPSIWALRGSAYSDIPDRLARYLEQNGTRAEDVTLDRIVIDADRRGVTRALAQVMMADSTSFARAVRLLAQVDSLARDTTSAGEGDSQRPATDTTAARAAGVAAADTTQAAAQRDTAARGGVRPGDLHFTDLHRLDVQVTAPGRSELVRLSPSRPWDTRAGDEFTPRDSRDFTLSDLYTVRGLFSDTNDDLVPDRTDAYLSLQGGAAAGAIVDFAARIGLETAGMRLPIVTVDRQEEAPESAGFPIAAGVEQYQLSRLRREQKLHAAGAASGEGFIELVNRGFGGRNGIVLGGADPAGFAAVTDYVAKRLPYLWDHGKGNFELADVETDVRRFFQAKETAGQVALGVHKTRAWLARLAGQDIDSVAIELATKERPQGLDAFLGDVIKERFPGAKTAVSTYATGFGVGRTIFEQDIEIPWEVDAFWKLFREQALPRLGASSRGRIDVRVSEAPQVRTQLAQEIKQALESQGVASDAFEVVVLSAYKQGYSWLYEVILPRLRGRPVGRIEITYHTLKDSKEVRWQEIESDTRWLQEIFPIDAVMAKELSIPDSVITFTATQRRNPIYTVRALDPSGSEILRESFEPKYVIRPYFDLFPEYDQVRVTTGWASVQANEQTILDQRIKTDAETFWDFFQTETYGRIVAYAMDVQDGRPSPANAPYFDELRVELTLSEPNHRIGIDEEVMSSVEALHEDIYFETLTLFGLIGNRYGVGELGFIGRVLPYIQPPVHGRPGRARITFTGKERGVPELVVIHRERGKETVRRRYALDPLPVDTPKLRGIAVRAGEDAVARLLFEVEAVDSIDRYEEYKARSSEGGIDRTFLPTALLADLVSILGELHDRRILENALSYDRVRELKFRFIVEDTTSSHQTFAALQRSRSPRSTRNPVLYDRNFRYRGQPIVQWETPIPPAESDSILAKLATFPVANVYYLTKSFLGQNVFAVDFLPPHEARYIAQAKLNALKPTLFISGRQHANEVSSTSHILRLAELLATDTSYTRLLRNVNVVLHPITNPDGARLAYEMQLVNPDFMLHAGYLGALGVDATSGANSEDPIYPESKVRPEIQATWLPDIYVNMHGYPSHEWVQYFAGYSAWVRGRRGTQRSWWAPRGWFIPGYSWVDDDRYPELKTAQFAILDSIAASITGRSRVDAMNRRLYGRYQKYGRQDVENFREYFHNGILVSLALRGREVSGQGPNNPRVTYVSMTTEAPDETARGDWLELVAGAGLAHSSALLRYLAGGVNEIRRENAAYEDFVTRSVFRKKPVLPRQETVTDGGRR